MHIGRGRHHREWLRLSCAAALIGLALSAVGCAPLGFVASGFDDNQKKIKREAQYHGLENKSLAVMVAVDEFTLFEFPDAALTVGRAVSARLTDNMETVTVMDPQKVLEYQRDNPYWYAVPYSELIESVGVDAIVLIDLVEYRTHEPGNKHLWQGVITGNVGVIEKLAADADNLQFQTTITTKFPDDTSIGLINSDDQTIQLGMLSLFSRDAAGLFYDHTIIEKQ